MLIKKCQNQESIQRLTGLNVIDVDHVCGCCGVDLHPLKSDPSQGTFPNSTEQTVLNRLINKDRYDRGLFNGGVSKEAAFTIYGMFLVPAWIPRHVPDLIVYLPDVTHVVAHNIKPTYTP